MHTNGNEWLLFSENGLYRSDSFGTNWTDANTGFTGRIVYRVQSGGDHLYALDISPISSDPNIYIRAGENAVWAQSGLLEGATALEMAAQGPDTLLTYEQISLDGGQTWTYISYPGVSGFSPSGIDIHDHQAFISLNQHVYKVPLTENPTATVIYGPSVTDNVYNTLFVGDLLYAATSKGQYSCNCPIRPTGYRSLAAAPGTAGSCSASTGGFFCPAGRIFVIRMTVFCFKPCQWKD